MQLLKTSALCVLLSLCYAGTSAQNAATGRDSELHKAALFNDLPQRMEWNQHLFSQLLETEIGEQVRLPVSPRFTLQGVVVSKSDARDDRSKTVVIKASNRPGASLTITGIKKAEGTYKYSGRMLSLKHSDAYEMVEEGGRFALEKKPLTDLVSE